MRNNYRITKFTDLEFEELRVKKRLKQQEVVIKEKLKTLPEEVVTSGITKIVSGILSGDIFKSAITIIKTVSSIVSGNENSSLGSGIINAIKKIVKDKVSTI